MKKPKSVGFNVIEQLGGFKMDFLELQLGHFFEGFL
jgi:hypothetical protein